MLDSASLSLADHIALLEILRERIRSHEYPSADLEDQAQYESAMLCVLISFLDSLMRGSGRTNHLEAMRANRMARVERLLAASQCRNQRLLAVVAVLAAGLVAAAIQLLLNSPIHL